MRLSSENYTGSQNRDENLSQNCGFFTCPYISDEQKNSTEIVLLHTKPVLQSIAEREGNCYVIFIWYLLNISDDFLME